MGNLFNLVLVHPILNVLVAIYQFLVLLHIPSPLGFSIILLTVLIRLVLYPVISAQMRTSKKMQNLTPHLQKVKEKHKGDSQKIQQETMKLYQEHGVNPAAGCVPLLIQLPVIWALYGTLQNIVKYTSIKPLNDALYFDFLKLHTWDPHFFSFFGLDISKSPKALMPTIGFLIILVPVVTGILQYFQSKILLPQAAPAVNKDKIKDKKEGSSTEDFAAAFQKQSLYLFPVMIGFFSFSLPIGLSLYWNTFSIFGIIQQQIMNRGRKDLALIKK